MESQKMIYAPPSREKSKQAVRNPLAERQGNGFGDEYMMGASNNAYAGAAMSITGGSISLNNKKK